MKNKKKIIQKVLSFVLSFLILISSLLFQNSVIEDTILTADAAVSIRVPINSLKDLYIFSRDYNTNPNYPTALLDIDSNNVVYDILRTQNFEDDDETYVWAPIGTEQKPFNGRIEINIATPDTIFNIGQEMTLFDYITDSVAIVNTNGQEQLIGLVKSNTLADGDTKPLLANHVVHDPDGTTAKWRIKIAGTGEHSGIIGTVGTGTDEANVNIELGVMSNSSIKALSSQEGKTNVGLICGTIEEDSQVNVTFIEPSTGAVNSVTSITSSHGCAGGFVGEMKEDSQLNIYGTGTNYLLADSGRSITGKTYAGGLVGKNDQGCVTIKTASTSTTDIVYDALGTVVSETASGGVYGYYKIKSGFSKPFSPDYYKSTTGCSLSADTSGALVGELYGNGNDVVYSGTSGSKISVKSTLTTKGTVYGGIIGKYSNSALTNKFEVEYVDVEMNNKGADYYGGVVGSLVGDSALYVKIDNFTIDSKSGASDCTYFGGAVGSAGDKGSLLDIGNISVTVGNGTSDKYKGGGVVGKMDEGVLRLSGTTNLSKATCTDASEGTNDESYKSNGQIVGERKNSLVYALGDGSTSGATYGNGWSLTRSATAVKADDIATWGEVLRISGAEVKDPAEDADTSAAILIYNSTAHTVTVGTAVTAMTNQNGLVRTALNMQLNDGNKGALKFDSGSNRTNLLKNTSLTIAGNISFSGTGVTGFMRDGFLSSVDEIKFFTGKLAKTGSSNATITLAVGERYGVGITSSSSDGKGEIHGHKYNGLFARTGDGAIIENIDIDGDINVISRVNNIDIGGAVALARNALTLTFVNASENINYNRSAGTNHCIGGLIGETNCDASKTITIQGTSSVKASVAPIITIKGSCISNIKDDDKTVVYQAVGGLIGYISSVSAATTSIQHVTVSPEIDASAATTANDLSFAGMIADIKWNATDTRTLQLTDIEVKNTKITTPTGTVNSTGGMLGYRWYGTNVEFSGVELKSGNIITSPSAHMAGLVYRATGYWTVPANGIKITDIAFKNSAVVATPQSLGMIVHDGYYSTSGMFLELTANNSYTLASGLSYIPVMTADGKIYDELVACLSKDAASLLKNNTSGVISYKTNGVYNMSGAPASRNSYKNIYNTSVVNNRSRYYYNADSVSYAAYAAGSTNDYKLLFWSLNKYAADNIASHFTNPFSSGAISGNFNLNNISYYPIDIDSTDSVTLNNANIIFYNDKIELTENTGSDTKRSTRDTVSVTDSNGKTNTYGKSQHYLMHMSLFKDVTGTINTTGSLTLSGTVGVNSEYSGALICGTMTGSLNTSSTGNIYIGYEKTGSPTTYTPLELAGNTGTTITDKFLLINSIGNKAVLDLNNLKVVTEAYTGSAGTYASSLIGDVQGIGINLKFSKIKIDGTTTGSIFAHASLLNKYDVDSTSVATYNFSQADDWGGSPAAHNVTYGKELSESVEYADQENRYYESDSTNGNYNGNYVAPLPSSDPGTFDTSTNTPNNSAADFSTGYLPYVRYIAGAEGVTPTYTLHEIKVNVIPSDLTNGCGTYDHPYVISTPKQLESISKMLDNSSTNNDNIGSINLPPKSDKDSHWCVNDSNEHRCLTFNHSGGNYTNGDTTDTWSKNDVKAYLASAYYQISGEITLLPTSSFTGLGAFDSTYAFKGVIVGQNDQSKITNQSGVPLIKISNGCVVKQLNIDIDNGTGESIRTVVAGTDITTSTAFSYAATDKNMVYGGVIGEIMGGDNIIDNVSVTYSNLPLKVGTTNHYLYTVGGYVGVVVNGALIFRNMTSSNFDKSTFAVNTSGSGKKNFVSSTDHQHLYINPYVGRVINGYAINETTKYSGDSKAAKDENDHNIYKYYNASGTDITDTVVEQTEGKIVKVTQTSGVYSYFTINDEDEEVNITSYVTAQTSENPISKVVQQYTFDNTVDNNYTLDNSTKNYQIADVNKDITEADKLFYDTFDSKNRVNIPTGQSLFILSLITQSGAGTATAADGNYAYAVGYDGNNKYNSSSAAENTATHLALYDKVGSSHEQGSTTLYKNDSTSDYYISKSDKDNNEKAIPYIIYYYTKTDSNSKYPARMMTGNTEFMKLTTQNGIYNLPEGFRGIGSICYGMVAQATDNPYQMHIYGFEGNGATINEQIIFNTYINTNDNYSYCVYVSNNINLGLGLFNVLIQKKYPSSTTYKLDEGYYIGDFVLSGKVVVKEYSSGGSEQGGAFSDSNNSPNRDRYSVGGLTAGILPDSYINLYNLDLKSIEIVGTSFVGGYIGRNNITEKDSPNGVGASKIYVNGCDTIATTVNGSTGCCGGIVGGSISGYPSIYVNTAQLKTGDKHEKGEDGYYKTEMELSMTNNSTIKQSGIGGIIGTLRNGYGVVFWINNVTVKGFGTNNGFLNNGTPTSKNQWYQGAGGLFGFVRKADSIIVTNCEINNLNIEAPYAGGLFGNIDFYDSSEAFGTSPVIKISKCKISSDNASTYSIKGIKGAGGITGQFTSSKAYDKTVTGYKGDTYCYDVDGCEISGYTISQTSISDKNCGAGGLFGYARATSGKMRTIVNTSVHDCTIKVDGSRSDHGMGSIIGFVPTAGTDNNGNTIIIDDSSSTTNTKSYCGDVGAYNIISFNNIFTYNGSGTSAKCGNFVGISNSQVFKIIGFSRKNNTKSGSALTVDYGDTPDSNSYLINADYKGISIGNDHGEAMSQIKSDTSVNVGEGAAKKYFPYVTVSPKIYTEDESDENPYILTGDGVSIVPITSIENGETVTTQSPIAKLILQERNSGEAAGDNRIKYSNITTGASSIYSTVNEMIANGEDRTQDYDIKLTTYFTEMGRPAGYEGDDFPIIAINGNLSNAQNGYNEYINAYIHTLTNSNGENYSSKDSEGGMFKVEIYPCQCIDGKYQRVDGTPGLERNDLSDKYRMVDANADSVAPNSQISMIDINYLDPTDSTKTAYHLYIPVLTKKMLKFRFSSAALQGAEYQPDVYTSKYLTNEWGTITKLASGFDTWQTVYLQYDYTEDDVNSFLTTGKGLLWNAPKTVYFRYNSIYSLDGSTQFVLLDNNKDVDKEYYALKSDLPTATDPATTNKYDVINFSSFKTERNNAETISSASGFEPQLLNDIAGTTVRYSWYDTSNVKSTGSYVLCADQTTHTDAVVYAYDSTGNNIKWFRAYDSDNDTSITNADRYDITVTEDITETYYLSMYAYSENNVISSGVTTYDTYGITVESPVTISSTVITCQRAKSKNTLLFLGDFIEQTLNITNYTPEKAITALSNHEIGAKLVSTLRFHGASASYFHKSLAGETLHQGFYLYLNRYDSDGYVMNDCSIKTAPVLSYSTKVGSEAESATTRKNLDEGAPYVYIPPVDIEIPEYVDGWSSTQEANISLEFGQNENNLLLEFPVKRNNNDYSGIHLEASAKFEFIEERVPYSNNITNDSESVPSNFKYYIDRTEKKDVLTLTAIDQPGFDAYDMYGFQSQNKSALGINGLYLDTGSAYDTMGNTEYIEAGLNYDMTNLPESVFDGTHTLTFTIVLQQKVNTNSGKGYEYIPVNIVDLNDSPNTGYLDLFEFYGKNTTAPLSLTRAIGSQNGSNYLYYTYTFDLTRDSSEWPINFVNTAANKQLNANLKFNVRTNEALKAISGYKYSNYRLVVTAQISGISSQPSDWIVYTNAKINAQYVKRVTSP